MGNYELTNAAEEDLSNLYLHGVVNFGLQQADDYYQNLTARFQQIADFPKLYQTVDHIRPEYRRSVCGVHSIYYQIGANGILIVRILRAQDPVKELQISD